MVPSKLGGGALGNAANKEGTIMRPPPPTIESIKPAKPAAIVIEIKGMMSKISDALKW